MVGVDVAQQVGSSVRSWPGMRSAHGWTPPSSAVTVTGPQQIGVSLAPHEQVVAECDGRVETFPIRPGAVFSNGLAELAWLEVTAPDEWLEIYPDAALLREAAGTSVVPEIGSSLAGRDAVVLGTASVLKRAHVGGEPLDELQASALAHGLARHVVARYCELPVVAEPGPTRLDAATADGVADLIEERLAQPLTLRDLAAEAAMSPFHFARTFRATTGLAPHQFLSARRMERAKELLLGTTHPVAEVAYAVGYANVSHFRRVFRRHLGCRPGDLRTR